MSHLLSTQLPYFPLILCFSLEDTKSEIKKKYSHVEVKTVQFDFAAANNADYERLKSELSKLEIGVLYNNVGVSYDYADALQNVPVEKVLRIRLL